MNKISFDDLAGKVCVITGGGGVIGGVIAKGLGSVGVRTAILDLNKEAAEAAAKDVESETGAVSIGVEANVLDRESLAAAKKIVNDELGDIDILINAAGGNFPKATTSEEIIEPDLKDLSGTFYGLDLEGFRSVFDLNFLGTILPTMVMTEDMVGRQRGVVLNISSMNSYRPLTKIPAYSAAKASINNLTEWLAVHLAKVNIRVNAVAPGFFLTNQNRFLLVEENSDEFTPRGKKIISGTPMGRFGEPEELQGAVLYLLSDISKFVTGTIIPIDGGFNAYSGI